MWLNERIIDGDDVDLLMLNCIAENDSADTTEAVDTDFSLCHSERVSIEVDEAEDLVYILTSMFFFSFEMLRKMFCVLCL